MLRPIPLYLAGEVENIRVRLLTCGLVKAGCDGGYDKEESQFRRPSNVPIVERHTGDGEVSLAVLHNVLLQDLGELGTEVSSGLVSVICCPLTEDRVRHT